MSGETGNIAGDEAAAPAASGPERVLMTGIRKRYGSIEALRGVDLRLMPGEVLGLVGDNAAGKSTLTKILAGATEPDAGEIRIDGEPVRFTSPAEARARRVEMVYQDLSLCDTIDVAGNLWLGREPLRGRGPLQLLDHARMREGARAMLDALHIRVPSLRALAGGLSGGQRQSVAIARAVSFEPSVLIMDEPTSALAVAEVEAVLRLITRVKERGVGVILITHRLQDLFRVCDRITVLYEGRNVAERRIEETNLEELVGLIVGERLARARAEAL